MNQFKRQNKSKSNRLFLSLIGASLLIHLFIVVHVSGMYKSKQMTYIEMDIHDASKPFIRNIPRPRIREKQPETFDAKQVYVQQTHIPQIKIEPVTRSIIPLDSHIGVSDIAETQNISGVSPLKLSQWTPPQSAVQQTDFMTQKDYFEMVSIRIESAKKYPEIAKKRQIEGRVIVGFIINKDGRVEQTNILKSSGHAFLDQSALNAIKNAVPFPMPPLNLFKEKLKLEISIVFELTRES